LQNKPADKIQSTKNPTSFIGKWYLTL